MKPVNIRDIPHALDGPSPVRALPAYAYAQAGRTLVTYFVQEKLNGIGFRARLRSKDVEMWTTRGKFWPANFFPPIIYNGLAQILIAMPAGAVLFGELTGNPDTKLATLGGQVSVNSAAFSGDPKELRARVYDVWPGDGTLFEYRSKQLKPFANWQHPAVRAVYTFQTECVSKIEEMFNDIIADGGEGVVIRIDPCILDPGSSGKHPMILKWKRLLDAEGSCVSVYEGTGKREGMLGGFTLAAILDGQAVTFNLGGGSGLTDEMLKFYWEHPPIGKLVTFTYEELSINNVPLRPQFVAVRDYEF